MNNCDTLHIIIIVLLTVLIIFIFILFTCYLKLYANLTRLVISNSHSKRHSRIIQPNSHGSIGNIYSSTTTSSNPNGTRDKSTSVEPGTDPKVILPITVEKTPMNTEKLSVKRESNNKSYKKYTASSATSAAKVAIKNKIETKENL